MDKVKGLEITNKQKMESEKINKEYEKEFNKKFNDYSKMDSDNSDDMSHNKYQYSEKELEYIQDEEYSKGMQDLTYNSEPDDRFKERAKKAIVGDSTMGNKPGANHIDNDYGEKLVDRTKRRNKKINDLKKDYIQYGSDIELTGDKVKGKPLAYESKITKKLQLNKELNNTKLIDKLIPENYKYDGNKFQLSDTKNNFDLTWNGDKDGYVTINEVVNESELNNKINEIKKRFKHGI